MLIAWNVILAALCAGLALATGLLALQAGPRQPVATILLLLAALCLGTLGALSVAIVPPNIATAELAAPERESLEQAALELAAPDLARLPTLAPTLSPAAQPAILPSTRAGAPMDLGSEQAKPPHSQPARLRIATLSVDVPVSTIPIVNGRWDLSALGVEVGWLTTTGAFPGDTLAMALVGHITTERLKRGAFADLEQIKPGDEIVVVTSDFEYVYHVRRRSRVTPEDVKALYVRDGQTLLLLTCTDWDPSGKRYANRLLVEAGLVEQRAAAPD
jgi:LPXTG-site transpeptidase (sortase) family protein